ncbi:hypothetical protein [Streptomyces sp. NPDC002602]|uniref:hypothetical protein n=1 Tax=Streptomyces sp. NPDC002602 TaxID=3364654 RepID=UPI0036C993E4
MSTPLDPGRPLAEERAPGNRRERDITAYARGSSTSPNRTSPTPATRVENLDAETYPFLHAIVGQVREHDDREQFLTGIAVVLDGLTHLR